MLVAKLVYERQQLADGYDRPIALINVSILSELHAFFGPLKRKKNMEHGRC
jgi:hypothetical protein